MKHNHTVAYRLLSLVFALSMLTSCKTSQKSDMPSGIIEMPPTPIVHAPFIPANFVARVHFDEGRYNNLLAPTTHAIWVDKNISEVKLAYEQESGVEPVPEEMIADAGIISDNFLILECHVETLFPDASVAYDVSSLRNLDVFLQTSEGQNIFPIQQLVLSPADEEQIGALKQFNRTNLIIFPMVDIITGEHTFPSGSGSVRLMIEGFGSSYSFNWIAQESIPSEPVVDTRPKDMADVIRWRPNETETYQVLKVRFSEMYTKLRALTHLPQD
ncbi:MAG: hypothetical protein VCD00_04680 [Candidatus Hydrogenedentota bacterium]